MQQLFAAFSCLLAVTTGFRSSVDYVGGGSLPPGAVSKREASVETVPSATSQDLYQVINETLENARRGVSADELKDRAEYIHNLAGDILQAWNVNVSRDEVRNEVNDLATEEGIQITLADILFDDSLTETSNKVITGLRLLQGLCEEGISLEAVGDSTDRIVGTILAVAKVLKRDVERLEGIVKFVAATSQDDENDEDDDGSSKAVDKRQFSVGLSYGGGGWGLSASYTWRG